MSVLIRLKRIVDTYSSFVESDSLIDSSSSIDILSADVRTAVDEALR